MVTAPFTVAVWSGDMVTRHGWIGDPLSVVVTERFNGVSTGVVTVSAAHHLMTPLTTPGVRLTVDYHPSGTSQTRRVLSGRISHWEGDGPSVSGTVALSVEGDFRKLREVLGWPVPGNALGSQSSAYYTPASAPAETVLKNAATANMVTRLGLPITVAADSARGANVKVTSRFHTLEDRLVQAVEGAGLGISMVQDDTSGAIVLDVFEPAAYPRDLTEQGGTVLSWSWSRTAPRATRVIAGDQGEAAARSFTTTIDTARESEWDDVVEVFIDARDTADAATLTQRRADALAEGAPLSGLSIELAEAGAFRYGVTGGVAVGDEVTVEVGPGVTITDVLRECTLSWTKDAGFKVSPAVGAVTDSPERTMARFVSRLARAVKDLQAGR